MIASKRDKRIDAILAGRAPKGFPADLLRPTIRKLLMLDTATTLEVLRVPPANHLEALTGNRKGQHSIRINAEWGICFVWQGSDAHDVDIVDYH